MRWPLRVYAFTKNVPEAPGYLGRTEVRFQQLQVRLPIGWVTIDEEEVPPHVMISLGCFGDTGGWVSKFAKFGRFGRDGVIAP